MPSCPTHTTPLRQWPSGDWFCPRKNSDGEFCDFVLRADGTQDRKKPRSGGQPLPAAKPSSEPASNLSLELRYQTAMDFASRIYSGTANSHDAWELARSIVRNWDVTWRQP